MGNDGSTARSRNSSYMGFNRGGSVLSNGDAESEVKNPKGRGRRGTINGRLLSSFTSRLTPEGPLDQSARGKSFKAGKRKNGTNTENKPQDNVDSNPATDVERNKSSFTSTFSSPMQRSLNRGTRSSETGGMKHSASMNSNNSNFLKSSFKPLNVLARTINKKPKKRSEQSADDQEVVNLSAAGVAVDRRNKQMTRKNWIDGESILIRPDDQLATLARRKFRELNVQFSNRVSMIISSSRSKSRKQLGHLTQVGTINSDHNSASLAASVRNGMHMQPVMYESGGVTKERLFKEWKQIFGEDIDYDMSNKLFDIMDCNKDGIVDEKEFVVVICFLLKQGSTQDNARLAFDLFDADKAGSLTQEDFSELLAMVIGTTLESVMRVEIVKKEFEIFAKSLQVEECILFYQEVLEMLRTNPLMDPSISENSYTYRDIPLKKACDIVDTFIKVKSRHELNLSDKERAHVINTVAEAQLNKHKTISGAVFHDAFISVRVLLAQNLFIPRFKEQVRSPPYSIITMNVWDKFKMKSEERMGFDAFNKWASSCPGLFQFLVDLQKAFAKSLSKATFNWAQRESLRISTAKLSQLEQLQEMEARAKEKGIPILGEDEEPPELEDELPPIPPMVTRSNDL